MLCFIHLFSLTVGLLATVLGLGGPRRMRRVAIMLACVGAMLAIFWVRFGKRLENPIEVYRHVERSLGCRIATSPLRWFVEVMLARRLWPELAGWSSLCLLVNALLVSAVHALDARLQLRTEADDRHAAEFDAGPSVTGRVPWALPLLGRWRGLGPIAWRQSMNAVRQPEQIGVAVMIYGILTFLTVMLAVGSTAILFLPTLDGHRELNPAGALVCGVFAVVMPMIIASSLSFDFRGDMGRIDVLKALPVGPIVLTAGQLCVPVAIVAVMQWLALAVVAVGLRSVPAGLWVAAAFVPPVSVVMMAIENLPALWFPLRLTPGFKPEPFEQLGHYLLHPLLKNAGHCAVGVATLVVSAAAYFLFGQHIGAALAAAWLALAAGGCGLVVLLAHVFDQFDVTCDVTD